MQFSNEELLKSLHTGFVDGSFISDNTLAPSILLNNKESGHKILSSFIHELDSCEFFWFSAAFLTTSGVATLKNSLEELRSKGIKGKILVSQYQNFTQPEALKQLLQFKNIELRINTDMNLHAKGYLFKKLGYYNLIIGSSNLTAAALTTNKELNIRASANEQSRIVKDILEDFDLTFYKSKLVDLEYLQAYDKIYKTNSIAQNLLPPINVEVAPNAMQIEALINLEIFRKTNRNKALLISATGTGKTYLSAFDAKKVNPKKLLFLVHRSIIAQKSLQTFKSIFHSSKKMGLYTGGAKDLDSDYIFSTIQTLSRQENLECFSKDHFEYIVIDETHRAGAESYLKILQYFKPNFLLGMTATPERTDGYDIFKHFDYNIAYELRLHKALEENMLAPFHYFGVADVSIKGELINEKSAFQLLTAEERVLRIIEKSKFYGSDNGTIRGLVFCSRVEESNYLSAEFNKKGLKTISLSGENTEKERAAAIELLEADTDSKIDYIFSVDIFNEGVDIPRINQIIMLRPTQSAIIFVQQLGRGLRKTNGKEYLTVIDFIGNYSNNFLVPIALYGDSSYNKDTIRKLMTSGSSLIPGESTINFDKISKEKIFKSIDSANLSLKRDLVNDYDLLKYKIGRTPMMMDFLDHGSRDPELFVDYSRSYYNFIEENDPKYKVKLNKDERKLLELFSKEINNGIRIEESLILEQLINSQPFQY